MNSTKEFLARLAETGIDLTEREIADALWLAVHMTGFRKEPVQSVPPSDAAHWAVVAEPVAAAPSAGAATNRVPVPLLTVTTDAAGTGDRHPLPPQLSSPRELRHPLRLQRALRPLARTIGTGPATVLDEEASAEYSADARTVIPMLAQPSRRWLSLALVVDTSPSMVLWDGVITELHAMLTQLGAFRSIHTWDLRFEAGTATISPRTSAAIRHSPKEIVDTTGRQAVLVVTDCVGEAWRSGVAMRAVDVWARTGPVAIVQPLSQDMWPRSAVTCHQVRLRSRRPGAPNHRLVVDPADVFLTAEAKQGVPVPILEIQPRWFASWSRLISSTDRTDAVVAFTGAPAPETKATAELSRDALAEVDPRRIVERFMAGASADALKLAGFLAAAPLTLPLMRHIQRAMLPHTRSQQLAEVYLGGLLRSTTLPGQENESALAGFEFRPGVRDVLLGTIRRSETIRVVELVSAERSRSPGTGQAGPVGLLHAGRGATASLSAADRRYAQIEMQVLRRIGGRYAQVVTGAPEPAPVVAAAGPPSPSQPPTPPAPIPPPPRQEAPEESLAQNGQQYGVTMWGVPGSGKTTLLGALSFALSRQRTGWNLAGANEASEETLIKLTRSLTRHSFPPPTKGIERFHWVLTGRVQPPRRGRRRRRGQSSEPARIGLDLIDASGEITGSNDLGLPLWNDLVGHIKNSRGIVLLFDPVKQIEEPAFQHTFGMLTELCARMIKEAELSEGRLHHHVAVCVSKFDDIRVLEAAKKMDLVEYGETDPCFPRVADHNAREFFTRLYDLSGGVGQMTTRLLENFFWPERIHYFVTSAIGFYVDPRFGVYDPDDPVNLRPDDNAPELGYIRGGVHPINVAEPLLWLGAQLAAESLD